MNIRFIPISVIGFLLFVQPISAQTWLSSQRITWNSGASVTPVIAVDSNDAIHVFWNDSTPGNAEVYYKKSTDEGANWSGARRLTWHSGESYFPAIAVDTSDAIHLVWYDSTPGNYEIYYMRSTDEGASWTGARRLTWNSGGSYSPAIAVDLSNKVFVLWSDWTPGNAEIYWKSSTDGGTSWLGTMMLTSKSAEASFPAIAVDSSNNTHVFWQEGALGLFEIYYQKSMDSGMTWSLVKRLTWNPEGSSHPKIALDSSHTMHMVWQDVTPGNAELFYKSSTDGGASWSGSKRLTWTSSASSSPAIVVDSSDMIHLVWFDSTPGNDEIFYKKSTDGGVNWSSNRLTWNPGSSEFPAIAVDSNDNLHLVWYDGSPGNFEIFYKKGIK